MAGDGTANNPFQVATASDLKKVGSGEDGWNLDSHYVQTEDIDMGGGWFAIISTEGFSGVYDGQGFTIQNVQAGGLGGSYGWTIFAVKIAEGGIVKNCYLKNVSISHGGRDIVSGFFHVNYGIIQDVLIDGIVMNEVSTSDCLMVGFGYENYGSIERCYIKGVVLNNGPGVTGGIGCSKISCIGFVSKNCPGGIISNCGVEGVLIPDYRTSACGDAIGFVNINEGVITDCYSVCELKELEYSGGVVPPPEPPE